jgi:hypothetical protein
MVLVVTSPVVFPCSLAISRMVRTERFSFVLKLISPFANYSPVAHAEAAAAESVSVEFAE